MGIRKVMLSHFKVVNITQLLLYLKHTFYVYAKLKVGSNSS